VGSGRASRASRASCGRVSRAASEVTLRASPGPAAVGFRESWLNHWGIMMDFAMRKDEKWDYQWLFFKEAII